MEFGVHLIGLGRRAKVEDFITATKAAEALGYHSVWINDHVIIPTHYTSQYPYTPDGRPSFTPDDSFYDPFVVLASLAAHSTTIRLGTSVAVIPYRNPILTAKMVATLDIVSGGRFLFGVGAGWFAEEMELLGIPFKDRASVTRESIEVMRALWTQERPHFTGKHYQFSDVGFAPKPLQKPHPPLWFGGETRAALKRVVRFGDGWFPAFLSPEDFGNKAAELKQLCAEMGRDFASLTLSILPANPAFCTVDAIRTYRQHGASLLLAPIASSNVDEFLAQMKRFKTEVMDPVRQGP
jgi:probable F420-dependent oxidoreductase